MPKVVGLEIGRHEIVAVEMEGSPRRFKVTAVATLPLSSAPEETPEPAKAAVEDPDKPAAPPPSEEASAELTRAIAQLFKKSHLARENVTLAFPGRHCVVRAMTLPFKGAEAIRKVIKFESEGQIYSRSVEDMVVDFHVIRETGTATDLLVFAAPKPVLKAQLLSLARAGIEPELVDLDSMALYRCAEVLGLFSDAPTGDADRALENVVAIPADGEDVAPVKPENPATAGNFLLIKVSADASEIVVIREGALAAVRTLRGGIDAIAEAVSRRYSLSFEEARKAVAVVLEGKDDVALAATTVREVTIEENSEAAEAGVPATAVLVEEKVVLEECARFNSRFTRELIRFLSGTLLPGGLRKVFMTGAGGLVPGLQEGVSAALSIPVEEFDPLARVEHSLPEEDRKAVSGSTAVAMGMALRGLGAARGLDLRQEDLVYARKFDRIKFPLALCAMLLVFVVLLVDVYLFKSVSRLQIQYGAVTTQGAAKGRTAFLGYVGWLVNKEGVLGRNLTEAEEPELEKIRKELAELDTFDRLPALKRRIKTYFDKQQEKSGYHPNLKLESGLSILVRWSEVLDKAQAKLGRFLVVNLELNAPAMRTARKLSFKVFYRGGEYTQQDAALRRALKEECGEPDSPFEKLMEGDEGETPAEGGRIYNYTLTIKERFDVFQPFEVATAVPQPPAKAGK